MTTGLVDHLVVAGETLEAGAALVGRDLGLEILPGGRHATMGTQNRLVALGPDDYLEVIAIDPDAKPPGRPRWFGLDGFRGKPRLAAWALRVENLDEALANAPDGMGQPMAMARGEYRWRISMPDSGVTPFDGMFPMLIEWQGDMPSRGLPDTEARLLSLIVSHPRAGALGWALSQLSEDDRVTVREGPASLVAQIHDGTDERVLR